MRRTVYPIWGGAGGGVHPDLRFCTEFPPGPLSIGEDLAIRPVELPVATVGPALALSATDSCRDRLAAFYHWNDPQGLRLAVEIARKQTVDLDVVKAWSVKEGMAEKYGESDNRCRDIPELG